MAVVREGTETLILTNVGNSAISFEIPKFDHTYFMSTGTLQPNSSVRIMVFVHVLSEKPPPDCILDNEIDVRLFDLGGFKNFNASIVASWSGLYSMAKGRFQENELYITIPDSDETAMIDISQPVQNAILDSSCFLELQAGDVRQSLKAERRDLDERARENEAALEKAYNKVRGLEEWGLESESYRKQWWREVQYKIKELQEQSLTLRAAHKLWQGKADEYAADKAEAARQGALRDLMDEAV
jgi:hypothetical protein